VTDEVVFDPALFPWLEGGALIEAPPSGFRGHVCEEHEPTLRAGLAGGVGA
jgi:hypothetical protein